MGSGHFVVLGGGVDLATGIRNDLPILEVRDQSCVVGVEQPCAADQGERHNVFIVGTADISLVEFVSTRIDRFVRNRARPAGSGRSPKPSNTPVVSAQLPLKPASDHQPSARTREPVEEAFARRRPVVSEHFIGHVGIDDRTHQRPTERRASSMKNCP